VVYLAPSGSNARHFVLDEGRSHDHRVDQIATDLGELARAKCERANSLRRTALASARVSSLETRRAIYSRRPESLVRPPRRRRSGSTRWPARSPGEGVQRPVFAPREAFVCLPSRVRRGTSERRKVSLIHRPVASRNSTARAVSSGPNATKGTTSTTRTWGERPRGFVGRGPQRMP